MASFLALASVLALFAGGCGAEGSHGAAVVGTALDSATREPLAGVEVLGPHGSSATSDAAGRFRLEGLHTGEGGEVVGRTEDGRAGRVMLRPLAPGELEIVLHLGPAAADGAGTTAHGD